MTIFLISFFLVLIGRVCSAYEKAEKRRTQVLSEYIDQLQNKPPKIMYIKNQFNIGSASGPVGCEYKDCTFGDVPQGQQSQQSQPATTYPHDDRDIVMQALPLIHSGRQWFGLYRAYVDNGRLDDGDFEKFCAMIEGYCPSEFRYHTNPAQLFRMNRLCFALPYSEWSLSESPVQSQNRYTQYTAVVDYGNKCLKL